MGRSGWWESLKDVRVRSVFVREKAGWGMVGQIGQTLEVGTRNAKIHRRNFRCGLVRRVLRPCFSAPPSSNGLAISL